MKITSHPRIWNWSLSIYLHIHVFFWKSSENSKLISFSINSDGEQRNLEEHIQSFGESLHRDHHKHQYLDYNHDHHYLDSRYRHIQYMQSFGDSLHHYHYYDHHDHHYLDYNHIEISSIFRALLSPHSAMIIMNWFQILQMHSLSWFEKMKIQYHGNQHHWRWLKVELPKYDSFYVDCVMSQLDNRHKICYIIKTPHKDHCTLTLVYSLWCPESYA